MSKIQIILKMNYSNFSSSSFFVTVSVVFFKELLQEFDVFIGHICYGVGVGAVEVDEPDSWDYFCSLSLDRLQVALAEPAVDRIIGIASDDDDLWDGECIGDGFELLFEPRAEADGQRGRKSCFARSGFSCVPILCRRELGVGCDIFFGVFLRVFYVGKQVFFQYGIFSCSLAGVLAFDETVVQHPRAFTLTDMQSTSYLFSRQHLW